MMYLFVLFNEFLRRLGYFTSRYDHLTNFVKPYNLTTLQPYKCRFPKLKRRLIII